MLRNVIRGGTASAIAASVEQALQSGKMAEGDRLPAIRRLAKTLHVSPVTVAAAYRLLRSRGLAIGAGRRGTALRTQAPHTDAVIRHDLGSDRLIDLATGNPDPALLPPLGPALRGVDPDTRLYGGPLDLPALVAFAAAEFAADGIASGPVAVTSGSLDAIDRVLREHVRAGDRVGVEDPTFPALLDLLVALGLVPVPVAVDDEGPRPEPLDRALGHVTAVVLSSRAQNPTGAAVSERRAADLTRLLRRRPEALVIEVDDSSVVSGCPLVTLTGGRNHWAVVRSTSKWLGPDLRVAVTTGDVITIARMQRRLAVNVRWVSHLLQGLTLALWSDPSSGRLLARAAEAYAERRRALLDALASHDIPAHGISGYNVWIPVREETATVQALAARGWAVAPGERFRLQSPPAVRVTTSALRPEQARRFAADLAGAGRPRAPAPA